MIYHRIFLNGTIRTRTEINSQIVTQIDSSPEIGLQVVRDSSIKLGLSFTQKINYLIERIATILQTRCFTVKAEDDIISLIEVIQEEDE